MDKTNDCKLLGFYLINPSENIYLFEFLINEKPASIDLSLFCQKSKKLPESSWQTAYDEHYLSIDGNSVIGDFYNDYQ